MLNGRDVSERKEFEEQLAHQAFHDPVTHLANRALFNERVRHAVARSLREGIGMAVVFIDLDDFKTVNDSLGHAAGDRVLLEVAQRISTSIRAADTAARFGGDEFAILLEDVYDIQSAAETAERILESLGRPLELDHNDIVIRASLGISVAEAGAGTDADELIRNADAAMYASPRARARAATASSSPRCTSGSWLASSCAPICSGRSIATSSSCTTSRWSASRTARSPGSRRGCAGAIPAVASSRRSSSSRSRRRAG